MKILHLSSEKTWRGGEQQIAYLIAELRNEGVESVVALRKNSEFKNFCIKEKIPFIELGFKNEFDLLTANGIKKFALKEKVDLLHLHSAKSHGLAYLASLLGLKTPMILSKRTDFPMKKNFFGRRKYESKSIKKILCVSKKIKEILDRDLKEPEKTLAVYSGVDISKFKFDKKFFFHDLLKLDHSTKLVGNTSAIADQKDYFTFVNVAEVVCRKRDDVRFLIIGNGPMENEIMDYVKSKKLEDKVLFTGFLNNLPEVLFNLDVFLITSKTEGLGTSILDAHACGIPVVGTDAGGIGEIVIDQITGSLCKIGDVKALSDNVLKRLDDKNTFSAKEFVKEFSKEATARNTLNIYKEVLS